MHAILKKTNTNFIAPYHFKWHQINSVYSHKHLGLILAKIWHGLNIILYSLSLIKQKKQIHLLSAFKYSMSRDALFRCYLSFVRPLLEYADIIFDNFFKQEKSMIWNLQYATSRLVTGAKEGTSRELLLKDCGICTMQNRRTFSFYKLLKVFSIINHQDPSYLEKCLPNLSGDEQRVNYQI